MTEKGNQVILPGMICGTTSSKLILGGFQPFETTVCGIYQCKQQDPNSLFEHISADCARDHPYISAMPVTI